MVMLTQGSIKQRSAALRDCSASRFVAVVNYDVVYREPLCNVIHSVPWDAIVLDESHRIKSASGRQSRYLFSLAKAHPKARRLCLTGTPMPHSPLDIYGQFRFLDPRVFGTSQVMFRNRYANCDPVFKSKVRSYKNQTEFAAKIDANAWRVTADEVLDLPDALHERITVTLSRRTMQAYHELERNCVAELERGTVVAANTLTKLLRLGQMTGGYCPVPRQDGANILTLVDGMPAKAMALEDWMSDLPQAEPIVVFCRFSADIEEVHAVCRRLGRSSAELSGGNRGLSAWQAGESDVIAVQIASGGTGIDLTRAAYAVYYSTTWSLGDYEQSLARLRRPGQTRCVRYFHLVAKDTVDEDIYAALRQRKDVVESVVSRLTRRSQGAAVTVAGGEEE